jgi:hypothetical protein
MQLHSIEAVIDPENTASEKVLLKNGYVKEAHILENEYYGGKFWDTVFIRCSNATLKGNHRPNLGSDRRYNASTFARAHGVLRRNVRL